MIYRVGSQSYALRVERPSPSEILGLVILIVIVAGGLFVLVYLRTVGMVRALSLFKRICCRERGPSLNRRFNSGSGAEVSELRRIERALKLRIERKKIEYNQLVRQRRCRENNLPSRTLTAMPGEYSQQTCFGAIGVALSRGIYDAIRPTATKR